MSNFTKAQIREHANNIVKIVLNNLEGWYVNDDIYEGETYDHIKNEIDLYLEQHNLESFGYSEILQAALSALWEWDIDEYLRGYTIRKAERFVYSKLSREPEPPSINFSLARTHADNISAIVVWVVKKWLPVLTQDNRESLRQAVIAEVEIYLSQYEIVGQSAEDIADQALTGIFAQNNDNDLSDQIVSNYASNLVFLELVA